MKILTGHQPVYLPWLGLIHKASLADIFVFMDDVQYLSQDWNNRNRIKSSNGSPIWLTVPVDMKNSSSNLLKDILIRDESNLDPAKRWQAQHWKAIQSCYGKSLFFKEYAQELEPLFHQEWRLLSELNLEILKIVFRIFRIECEIAIASKIGFSGRKSDLVLEHAKHFGADCVVTGTHGKDYIQLSDFEAMGVRVYFQDYQHPTYEQRFGGFVSHLSFIDLLFNCGPRAKEICLSGNVSRSQI